MHTKNAYFTVPCMFAYVELCLAFTILYDPRRLLHRITRVLCYRLHLVVSESVQSPAAAGLASLQLGYLQAVVAAIVFVMGQDIPLVILVIKMVDDFYIHF